MHSAQEFVAEDLGEEDIVGLVLGFELVATDGAVGAAVEGADGGGNVLGELRAGGGVNGLWEREAFDGPESDDSIWMWGDSLLSGGASSTYKGIRKPNFRK
jgi:hypothetical protein